MSSTTEHRAAGSGDGAHPAEVTAVIAPVPPARHSTTPGRSPHAVSSAGYTAPRAYRPVPHGLGPGVPAGSAPFRPGPAHGAPGSDHRRPDATRSPYALPGGHPAGLGPGYGPPPPTAGWVSPHGMRWGWIAIGIVGAILVVAMLGSLASAGATMTVPGTVTLASSSTSVTSSSSCTGLGFQSYVEQGTLVTIYDATGKLVGTGALGSGTPTSGSSYYYSECVFSFTLSDVPSDSDFYRIKIGTRANDGVPFSAEELRSGDAGITIGMS